VHPHLKLTYQASRQCRRVYLINLIKTKRRNRRLNQKMTQTIQISLMTRMKKLRKSEEQQRKLNSQQIRSKPKNQLKCNKINNLKLSNPQPRSHQMHNNLHNLVLWETQHKLQVYSHKSKQNKWLLLLILFSISFQVYLQVLNQFNSLYSHYQHNQTLDSCQLHSLPNNKSNHKTHLQD